MTAEFFLLKVRFRGRFTSYSPAVEEGFIDSTTLHAALLSAAALLGYTPTGDEFVVGSLLPVVECDDKEVGLLPPLRLPGSNKVTGFWSPTAAREALKALLGAGGRPALLSPESPRREAPCPGEAEGHRLVSLRVGGKPQLDLVLGDRVIYLPGEDSCMKRFKAPRVSSRHRLAIDRVTQAATPIMYQVVEAPLALYWSAGLTKDCEIIEGSAAALSKLGLGALRSTGHGSLEEVDVRCGSEALESLGELLGGLALEEAGNGIGVLLGLYKPLGGSLDAYGVEWVYGAYRGYGGFIEPFRRPLLRVLAPGSIILRPAGARGLIYRNPGGAYVYSFRTLIAKPAD